MIAYLEGIVTAGGTEAVITVGGGIGLDVQLSRPCRPSVCRRSAGRCGSGRIWRCARDAWSLYGFVEEDERAMFRLLITVSGVGPKVALGMLSRGIGPPRSPPRCAPATSRPW